MLAEEIAQAAREQEWAVGSNCEDKDGEDGKRSKGSRTMHIVASHWILEKYMAGCFCVFWMCDIMDEEKEWLLEQRQTSCHLAGFHTIVDAQFAIEALNMGFHSIERDHQDIGYL